MKRAIAIALMMLPGAAFGQSYQTALPLSPQERLALEARLSTVLDYARPNDTTEIVLPTGRVATVRTYQKVNRGSGRPCRGYRLDLVGRGSRTAVDGFRCRQPAGSWVITEPEIVLAQEAARQPAAESTIIVEESGPLDLRGGLFGNEVTVVIPDGNPDGQYPDVLPRREPGEPLYPGDDDNAFSQPSAPPPVPRPAPRRTSVAANEPDEGRPLDLGGARPEETALTEQAAPEPPVVVPPTTVAAEEPDEDSEAPASPEPLVAATPETPAEPLPEEVASAEADDEPGTTVIAAGGEGTATVVASPTSVARQVGVRETTDTPDYASDERVMAALEDLDYLDPSASNTPEAVTAAVDEFARDERFALPVSTDLLVERLTAALDRSETIAECGPGSTGVCVAR